MASDRYVAAKGSPSAPIWGCPIDGRDLLPSGQLNSGVEYIAPLECLRLVRNEDVGRMAVIVGGKPDIFPVNYIVDDDDTIIFQTGPGTKLAGALGGSVAFEVDHLDRATRSGWSVVVRGVTDHVSLPDSVRLRALMASRAAQPWPRPGKPYLIRIVPVSVSGRRIPTTGA